MWHCVVIGRRGFSTLAFETETEANAFFNAMLNEPTTVALFAYDETGDLSKASGFREPPRSSLIIPDRGAGLPVR